VQHNWRQDFTYINDAPSLCFYKRLGTLTMKKESSMMDLKEVFGHMIDVNFT
jgi:hypothetical protein